MYYCVKQLFSMGDPQAIDKYIFPHTHNIKIIVNVQKLLNSIKLSTSKSDLTTWGLVGNTPVY